MTNSKQFCVLVTGVGGDIGYNVIRCLRESSYNLQIVGCDIDPYAAGRKYVDVFLQAPKVAQWDSYILFMGEAIRTHGIKFLYPITEPEIAFFNQFRDYYTAKAVMLLLNNSFIINTFLDQWGTIVFLRGTGLPYPMSYPIELYNNELNFPLVLKARKGCGGKGVIIVHDSSEFDYYRGRVNNWIVQEYIGSADEEYTAGVFSDGIKIHSICFQRTLGLGSMSRFVRLVHNDEVEYIVAVIAQASQLVGSLNVQLRKTERGFVPFEINPRISSTVYFRHYFGFQDVNWWLDYHTGRSIEYKPKYTDGVGVRTVEEIFFDLV